MTSCWRIGISPELATNLLILLTFVVGGSPTPDKDKAGPTRSEETKLACCECLLELFECVCRSNKSILNDIQTVPAVGHTVITLLDVLSAGETVDLQLVSCRALEVLLFECMEDADERARFYPGIVSKLTKAMGLGSTSKRPSRVLQAIVKFLDRMICSVLSDISVANLPESTEGKNSELDFQRNTKWLEKTTANTKTALASILKLRTHPKVEVKKAIFELCRDLLEKCASSLQRASDDLLESLVILGADEDEFLARISFNTVRVMASFKDSVKDSLREILYDWITTLPRMMTGNNEDSKTNFITRLSAMYELTSDLGICDDLLQVKLAESIYESLPTKKTLKKAREEPPVLSHYSGSLELISKDRISRTTSIATFPDVLMSQRSQMNTLEGIKRLLDGLGKSPENSLKLAQGYVRNVSESVHSVLSEDNITSLWMVINMLRSSTSQLADLDEFVEFNLVGDARTQQFVSEELFAVAISILDGAADIEGDQGSVDCLLCLAIEAISVVAQVQKRSFRNDLIDALYPIVHYLGVPSPLVQNHAIIALNNLTVACEYSSAKELILENVDYLVNAVSLKFNSLDISPQAPGVLKMVIKLVGSNLVPYLDDLVVSIFSILRDYHEYEKLSEAMFQVLGTIVEETASGPEAALVTDGKARSDTRGARPKPIGSEKLIEILKGTDKKEEHEEDPALENLTAPKEPWGKAGKDPENPFDMDEDEDAEAAPPPEEPEVKVSTSFDIVKRITLLSQNFLTHESSTLRVQLLYLVSCATTVLRGNEDHYLPVVNELWPVVYDRIFDDEPHIIIQACNAIASIADACGPFLSSRISDAWPGIRKVYLKAYGALKHERREKSGGLGIYSMHYKVWDAFVKMLVVILGSMPMSDVILDEIFETCGSDVLAERSDLREALEDIVPDSVWLEMERSAETGGRYSDLPQAHGVLFVEPVF